LTLAIELADGLLPEIHLGIEGETQQSHLDMAFHVQIAIAVDLPVRCAGIVIVMIGHCFQATRVLVLFAQTIIDADHKRPFITQHLPQA
jgi:hypothetical protein